MREPLEILVMESKVVDKLVPPQRVRCARHEGVRRLHGFADSTEKMPRSLVWWPWSRLWFHADPQCFDRIVPFLIDEVLGEDPDQVFGIVTAEEPKSFLQTEPRPFAEVKVAGSSLDRITCGGVERATAPKRPGSEQHVDEWDRQRAPVILSGGMQQRNIFIGGEEATGEVAKHLSHALHPKTFEFCGS